MPNQKKYSRLAFFLSFFDRAIKIPSFFKDDDKLFSSECLMMKIQNQIPIDIKEVEDA